MINYNNQIKLLSEFYAKLYINKNGFTFKKLDSTNTNLTGPNLESHMEYYKVKPKKMNIIDLWPLIGTDTDMEFSDGGEWHIHFLNEIRPKNLLPYIGGITKQTLIGKLGQPLPPGNVAYKQCRIRLDCWHPWDGGKCILPVGLIVELKFYINSEIKKAQIKEYTKVNWKQVIGFKVIGKEKNYIYEYEG